MKISDLEVGKEYAVKKGRYGKRSATEHIQGMEHFNPHCVAARVLEIGIERRVGIDYATGKPKTRSNFVKVLYKGRNDYDKGAYEATIPSSNIVAPLDDYTALSKKYWAEIAKKRKKREAARNKAQKHIDTVIAEVATGLGRKKVRGQYVGFDGGIPYWKNSNAEPDEYLAEAMVSVSYNTLLTIAEKLTGHKIDVPVVAEKKK